MSLGIALKGPEGIVLAADSRVTLFNQFAQPNQPNMLLPSFFDNATKLLRVKGQDFVAAITYGAGAIGQQQPRTAHSFIPEFEAKFAKEKRLKVSEFAKHLSDFFLQQWQAGGMPAQVNPGQEMVFLIGGYDEGQAYGQVFEVHVPTNPVPVERIPVDQFGAVWGGQRNITDRLLQGFDSLAIQVIYDTLQIPQNQRNPANFEMELKTKLALKIPIQFLPLQDSVDFAIFLIRATILLQKWIVDVRGVGGAVDVATITRTEGFRPVQVKQIVGEKVN